MADEKTNFQVRIWFETEQDPHNQQTYSCHSQGELDAYLVGVSDAIGFTGYSAEKVICDRIAMLRSKRQQME